MSPVNIQIQEHIKRSVHYNQVSFHSGLKRLFKINKAVILIQHKVYKKEILLSFWTVRKTLGNLWGKHWRAMSRKISSKYNKEYRVQLVASAALSVALDWRWQNTWLPFLVMRMSTVLFFFFFKIVPYCHGDKLLSCKTNWPLTKSSSFKTLNDPPKSAQVKNGSHCAVGDIEMACNILS